MPEPTQDPRTPVKERATQRAPSSKEVEHSHTNSDRDSRQEAQHHTLGSGHNQASPGDHNHDGGSSSKDIKPLSGQTITGTRGTATCVPAMIAMLVRLGATDGTTA